MGALPIQMLSIQKMRARPPSKNNVQDDDCEGEEDIDDLSRNDKNKTKTLDKQVNDEYQTKKKEYDGRSDSENPETYVENKKKDQHCYWKKDKGKGKDAKNKTPGNEAD